MERTQLIQLIQKSQNGDMDAMEKLLLYAHTSVSYQCRKMLKNDQDAEDMTQEILVTVYQKLDTLQEPAAFNKWLHQITASRCINAINRTHTEYQFAEDEEGHTILDTLEEMDEKKVPDKWLDNQETARMITQIISDLPDVQRMCTLMFYYSELSVKEIAQTMKVSENTVKSRLNYARKAIKDKVQDYEKQGIKLYGLSPLPFIFYFLRKTGEQEHDPAGAQLLVDKILAEEAAAAGIVAVGSATSGSAGAAAAAASVPGTGGLLTVFSAVPVKIFAGVAAALVLLGGAAAAVFDSADEAAVPAVLVAEQGETPGQEEAVPLFREETEPEEPPETTAHTAPPETIAPTEPPETTAPTEPPETTAPTEPPETTAPTEPPETTAPIEPPETTAPTESPETTAPTEPDLTEHIHTYYADYTQEPSCAEPGYTLYRCSACTVAAYRDDYTEQLPHNYEVTVVPPTAYSQGYTKYVCTAQLGYGDLCLHSYTADYTEKLPEGSDTTGCTHSFVERGLVDESYTYGSLLMEYACEYCGFSYTEILPEHTCEHEWVFYHTFEPTCYAVGYDRYDCQICYATKEENAVPALGHDCTAIVVEPTENAPGYTLFTCIRCDATFKDNYTELTEGAASMHTHSYTAVENPAPSCADVGSITYSCECGHYYLKEVPVPHSMESRVVAPTAEAPGYTEYWCTVCGYSYKRAGTELQGDGTVIAHTHNYNSSFAFAATCEENGRTGLECICGEQWVKEYTPSLGHSWSRWVTVLEPSETTEGIKERSCSVCSATETGTIPVVQEKPVPTEPVDAAAHVHAYVVSYTEAPDCQNQGYTVYRCSLCDHDYKSDYTDTLPHSYTVTVVPATEFSQGYTSYECTNALQPDGHICGHIYTADYTEKLPAGSDTTGCVHSFAEGETIRKATCSTEGVQKFVCQYCDYSYTESIPMITDPVLEYYGTVEATCDVEGYDLYQCQDCLQLKRLNIVPDLEHDCVVTVIAPTETEQGYTEFKCRRCEYIFRDNYTDPVVSAVISEEEDSHGNGEPTEPAELSEEEPIDGVAQPTEPAAVPGEEPADNTFPTVESAEVSGEASADSEARQTASAEIPEVSADTAAVGQGDGRTR